MPWSLSRDKHWHCLVRASLVGCNQCNLVKQKKGVPDALEVRERGVSPTALNILLGSLCVWCLKGTVKNGNVCATPVSKQALQHTCRKSVLARSGPTNLACMHAKGRTRMDICCLCLEHELSYS